MCFINVNILGSQQRNLPDFLCFINVNILGSQQRNLPDFMCFINVNILGFQCAHSTNDLVCYVGLKMTD